MSQWNSKNKGPIDSSNDLEDSNPLNPEFFSENKRKNIKNLWWELKDRRKIIVLLNSNDIIYVYYNF